MPRFQHIIGLYRKGNAMLPSLPFANRFERGECPGTLMVASSLKRELEMVIVFPTLASTTSGSYFCFFASRTLVRKPGLARARPGQVHDGAVSIRAEAVTL